MPVTFLGQVSQDTIQAHHYQENIYNYNEGKRTGGGSTPQLPCWILTCLSFKILQCYEFLFKCSTSERSSDLVSTQWKQLRRKLLSSALETSKLLCYFNAILFTADSLACKRQKQSKYILWRINLKKGKYSLELMWTNFRSSHFSPLVLQLSFLEILV